MALGYRQADPWNRDRIQKEIHIHSQLFVLQRCQDISQSLLKTPQARNERM